MATTITEQIIFLYKDQWINMYIGTAGSRYEQLSYHVHFVTTYEYWYTR